jgi:hypothetical protein
LELTCPWHMLAILRPWSSLRSSCPFITSKTHRLSPGTIPDCLFYYEFNIILPNIFVLLRLLRQIFAISAFHKYFIFFYRNKVPLLYANCKAAVDKELAIQLPQCKGVSFTADYWTSRSCDPYLGMTLHFITPEFEMKKLMVACKSAEGRHTGQNIANHIDKVYISENYVLNRILQIIMLNIRT